MTWQLTPCSDYEKRKKDFSKKWPAELRAVVSNLMTLLYALQEGTRPEQLKLLGFVHGNYPLGILSIDETGHGKSSRPKALRLYVFPCETEQALYVMLIGEKARQSQDVALCKEFVAGKLAEIQQSPSDQKRT